MDEPEIRSRLEAAADRFHVGDPPIELFVRRGRGLSRRARVRTASGAAVALLVIATLIWSAASLSGIRGGPSTEPRQLGRLERFDVGGRPIRRVAIGGEAAWFIVQDHGPNGRLVLVRIDDRTGQIRRVGGLGEPQYVAAGFGSIWVSACLPRTREDASCPETVVFEVDPATGRPISSVRTGAGQSVSLAVGEGAVWEVVNLVGGRDVLVRVKPRTLTEDAIIPLPGCCGLDLAVGEGAVWAQNDRGIVRVDPQTNEIVKLVRIRDADNLAAGAGFVWVNTARFSGPAPVDVLDPATNEVVRSIMGPGYGFPMVASGRVWLAVVDGQTIVIRYATPGSGFVPFPIAPKAGPAKSVQIGPGGPVPVLGIGDDAIWTGTDDSEQIIRIDVSGSLTN